MNEDITLDFAAPLYWAPAVTVVQEGEWFVARPEALKPGYVVVTAAHSRTSADAEALLRKMLTI